MNKSLTVFLVRLVLGVAGGWLMQHFFFPKSGWPVAVILGALVVVAAYLSEGWRTRGESKK